MEVGRNVLTIGDDETRANTRFFTRFPVQNANLKYAVLV